MHDITNFKHYKSLLCLNGELPDVAFFRANKLPIISADGAANQLHAMGIHPQIIIGDLDSASALVLETTQSLHLPCQNSNDFQKTLGYLSDNGLLPSIIVGINGGCLDHVLNNINIFMGTECLLYAPPLRGFVLNAPKKIRLTLPENTKISLLGIPNAEVSSTGLKWELNQSLLTFPGATSCYNRVKHEKITLEVHQGDLLVLMYETSSSDAGIG
jgi:thiamine pyrophosphokinase